LLHCSILAFVCLLQTAAELMMMKNDDEDVDDDGYDDAWWLLTDDWWLMIIDYYYYYYVDGGDDGDGNDDGVGDRWVRVGRWSNFYRAMLCISAVYAVTRCLSVRPSVCRSFTVW